MAYVAPKGIIELYQSVPLTPSYEHTLWFGSDADQRSYFEARTFMTFTNQMYTRVHGNKVRIHANAELVNRCSYLGFKNDLKWYYAFIIQCEYINEQVTEITYQLDHIQTWFRSMTLRDCFIERQHATNDDIGENVQPEPITANEHIGVAALDENLYYYPSQVGYVMSVGLYTVLSGSGQSGSSDLFHASKFGGLGSTIRFLYFDNADKVNAFLKATDFTNGVASIVGFGDVQPMALYAVPGALFTSSGNDFRTVNIGSYSSVIKILPEYANQITSVNLGVPTVLGEPPYYTPKNKKLFTYPYSLIRVSFPNSSQDFKFENFFLGGESYFRIYATCNPVPSIIIVPIGYELDNDQYHYALTLDSFPQLTVYQDGVGAAAGQLIAQTLKTAIFAGASYLGGGGAAAAAVSTQDPMDGKYGVSTTALAPVSAYANQNSEKMLSIKNNLGMLNNDEYEDTASSYIGGASIPHVTTHSNIKSVGGATDLAPIMAQKFRSGSPVTNEPIFSITFQQFSVRNETAKRFDEFFHKYGYAQNKVGTPNIHARSKWTYVKTRGCNVGGPIPAEAMRAINYAMDKGITWWADQNVSRYCDVNGNLLDNTIL